MVLLGETPAELREFTASETATEVMYQVAKVQSEYWKSIDVVGCEPPDRKLVYPPSRIS
jgi:histone deacetylase 6